MKTIEKGLHKVERTKGWMSSYQEISQISQEAVVLTEKIHKSKKIAQALIIKRRKILWLKAA